MKRWPVAALALAALCIAFAAWHFGRGLEAHDHLRHPLAALGAGGAPGWRIANVLLFVLPGALVMSVAWVLRGRLPAQSAWPLRMALQFGLLAALGYALQGLCNLDLARLPDDGANRLHAASWLLWWSAFSMSALMLGFARGMPGALRGMSLVIAALFPLAMLGLMLPAALAHRVGIGVWLTWWFAVALALSRSEASSPKPSSAARK